MADSDKVILLKIEVAQAQANANVKKLEASLNKLDGRTKEYTLTLKKLQLERTKLADLRKRNSKSISNYANELGNANKQTGAATSATLEFGRVLSDAPYGIRGVANNLQQLASNLFFMSKGVDNATGKTLGFGGAIGTLGKSLLGPAGILVAFQGITAALDFFFGAATKAESSASDFESSLTSLRRALDDLGVSQEDINQKIEDYIILQDLKKKLDKSQEESTERLLEIEEELISLREDNAKKQKKLLLDMTVAEYEALSDEEKAAHRRETLSVNFDKRFKQLKKNIKEESELEKEKRDITKGSLEIQKEYNKSKKLFNAADEDSLKGLKNSKKEKEAERELLSKTSQEYKKLTIVIDEYQKKIEAIEGKKAKGSGKKLSPFKNLKDFDEDAEDYLEQIRSLAKKTELLNAKTQVEKIEIERKHHIQNLKIKHEEDKEEFTQESEAYKAKLKLFLDYQVKTGKMSQGQANQELSDFNINISKQLDTMDENFPTLLIRWQNYYTKKAEAAKISEIGTMKPLKDEIEAEFTLEDGLRKYMELQSSMTSFLSGEYDRQLTIEQNKTNALNNELNERLLNENLSKDERERIQLQIGRNDEKLRKTQEAIEKKRFKLNKAANIANATINTYLGATQVLSSKTIPDVAKPFVMAATIASGLMQVAAIARQKFQSSAGSGGSIGAGAGGAGSGGEGREFNFNLAGSTQSNQLTQSIASQLNQPIQAYVVSSDITSQQQLDLNISNTATIG